MVSGMVKAGAAVQNYTRQEPESLSHLYIMQGRKPVEVQELHAGDLGAAVKLRTTLTGDTLGDKGRDIFLEPVTMPEAAIWADHAWGTAPAGLLIGIVLGTVAAVVSVVKQVRRFL